MSKSQRNFPREFKPEAVCRIAGEDKSLAEVAREHGPGGGLLRSWKATKEELIRNLADR